MISHFERLERQEGVKFGPGLVIQGAKERLAPIMMTALATGLALVPLVVAGSIPGHEIEHPMAIVILGGLVTATLGQLVRAALAVSGVWQEQARESGACGCRSPSSSHCRLSRGQSLERCWAG